MLGGNLVKRLVKYYRKRGILNTVKRGFEQCYRWSFLGKTVITYSDLNEIDNSALILPSGIAVEAKVSYNDVIEKDTQQIVYGRGGYMDMDRYRKRFMKGAVLWILKVEGDIVGFGWTIRGKMVAPWFLPLTPNDAVFFDFETLEKYRGKGFNPLLRRYIAAQLKVEGVTRVFGFIPVWNKASLRATEKSGRRKLMEAREFHLLGRNLIIWRI